MQKQSFHWQKYTLGVCYYPEHWPKTMWREDLRRMKEAGISTVRVAAFREFVKGKYGTLEALNETWGNVFWSETYTGWSQIHCPRPVLNSGYNPHMMLDYSRFVSESCISFAKMQADIII